MLGKAMERFANSYDECYCPSCHSRESSPNNPHLKYKDKDNMVCLNCGWIGHFTELTSLERLKNIKRTELIERMLDEKGR